MVCTHVILHCGQHLYVHIRIIYIIIDIHNYHTLVHELHSQIPLTRNTLVAQANDQRHDIVATGTIHGNWPSSRSCQWKLSHLFRWFSHINRGISQPSIFDYPRVAHQTGAPQNMDFDMFWNLMGWGSYDTIQMGDYTRFHPTLAQLVRKSCARWYHIVFDLVLTATMKEPALQRAWLFFKTRNSPNVCAGRKRPLSAGLNHLEAAHSNMNTKCT